MNVKFTHLIYYCLLINHGNCSGLSGCGGLFTDEVLTTMGENCPSPPIIFPLSNPTSRYMQSWAHRSLKSLNRFLALEKTCILGAMALNKKKSDEQTDKIKFSAVRS